MLRSIHKNVVMYEKVEGWCFIDRIQNKLMTIFGIIVIKVGINRYNHGHRYTILSLSLTVFSKGFNHRFNEWRFAKGNTNTIPTIRMVRDSVKKISSVLILLFFSRGYLRKEFTSLFCFLGDKIRWDIPFGGVFLQKKVSY